MSGVYALRLIDESPSNSPTTQISIPSEAIILLSGRMQNENSPEPVDLAVGDLVIARRNQKAGGVPARMCQPSSGFICILAVDGVDSFGKPP
jgi:hypothetical protein